MNTRFNSRRGLRLARLGAWAILATACVDTGAPLTSAELRVQGDTESVIAGRDGWIVSLQQAQVAFGPLWLCAGNTAGELCDVARAEWLDAVVVDALDATPKDVGEIWGNEGAIRSWMYDYGLVSLLAEKEPYSTEAAQSLGGNSVRIQGCAEKSPRRLCFSLQLPIAQSTMAEQGVPVVRVTGSGDSLAEFGRVRRLTASFDAGDWLGGIDFEGLAAQEGCEPQCAEVVLGSDSQAARSVRSALEGTARPKLIWKR